MRQLVTTAMLTAALLLPAAGFAEAVDASITATEKQWAAAIKSGDTATLEKMLGDKLIYAHATGIIDTKKDYIAKVGSGRQKYDGVDHEKMEVRNYGSTVVVHGHMHMWGTNQAGKFDDYLMMMHVWVKQGGHWQLVAHQTTKLR